MKRILGLKQFIPMLAMVVLSAIMVVQSIPLAQAQGEGVRRIGIVSEPGVEMEVIFCGDLANNTISYMGPASGFAAGAIYAAGLTANDLSFALAGSGCSTLDSTTEATADAPLYANNAIKVLGMACTVDSSGAGGLTFTVRSAAAEVSPAISLTIATTKTTNATAGFTTTDIAAGATMAIKVAANGADMSSNDAWCKVRILVMPS